MHVLSETSNNSYSKFQKFNDKFIQMNVVESALYLLQLFAIKFIAIPVVAWKMMGCDFSDMG